jgi:2-phosphoglycerate kinase
LKTLVINKREQTRIPFLRGILTRSLLDAGLPFEHAFELATLVRRDLAAVEEISTEDLRALVQGKLEVFGDAEALEHYRQPVIAPTRILVYGASGAVSAFSRGHHERYLQSSGLRNAVAEEITLKIYDQLLARGAERISSAGLGYLTYRCLKDEVGRKAANRYLVWAEFQQSEKPLLLLIGGAVGTGKSSVATEIAHRLEIVRIQSTDMLREVMRMLIPQRLMPVLHASSFEAWRYLPVQDEPGRDRELLVEEGFRSQAELLSVPCEAVLHRAEQESVPIILEGVHALPGLLERAESPADAIMVHVTMAVLSTGELKARLRGRGVREPKRQAKKYLKNFEDIWHLQSHLLSEADRHDAPIIPNDDKERAINQIIITVNERLSRQFKGKPAEVFGKTISEFHQCAKVENWQDLVALLVNR